jgi:hypothetical protein
MSDPDHLIPRYYAYRATNSAGLYLPIAIYFLVDQGYSNGFVLFSYAVFSLASVAAEIPTGYLGDLVGRRGSLALGAGLRVVALATYPFVETKLAILAIHVVWAVGRAFRSGTVDAWLYEMLQARFDESEYARIEGRGSTVLLVTSAVGAITGAFLYTLDPAYPFLANAGLALLGLPILFTFPAVATAVNDDEVFTLREAIQTLRLQAGRPAVRWLVVYAAVFQATFSVTRSLEQPALSEVGIPVAGLGVLYAAFKLVSAGAASTAGRFEETLGARGVFALLVPLYAVAYAALAVVPLAIVPLLFVNRSRRLITRPVRNQYLNDRLENVGRATVLSGAAMVLSTAAALAKFASSAAATGVPAVEFLPWVGVGGAALGGILWLATSPVRDGSDGAFDPSPGAEPGKATPTD